MCLMILASLMAGSVLAQEQEGGELPAGVAEYVPVAEEGQTIESGHIVELFEGSYRLATIPYSDNMFGVVRQRPALAVSTIGRAGAQPVIQSGISEVLVSDSEGRIEPGDFVTTSTEPGVGVKAIQAGMVLGIALEGMPEGESGPVQIPVSVDIKYAVPSQQDESLTPRSFARQIENVLALGVRAAAAEPNTFLRYLAATLIMLAAMAFGFLVFGRSATNGVISIGRNPLARKSVFFMVFVNVGLALGLVAGGLVLGFFILAV